LGGRSRSDGPVGVDRSGEEVEYLDFAIAEFRDMNMNTYLERALRHKEILKA